MLEVFNVTVTDFWMIKSGQNVIGSVMCCPGCFSLYRASALRQVMDEYATPTVTPFTVYVKDTGEDRWMATLMMIHGWRLRYNAFADTTTYCPDTFEEFFKQRRRWILSDIANMILVVQNMPRLLRNNSCFSLVYVLYLLNMFTNNVITPGTAIVMITAGMELVFEVPYLYTTPTLAIIIYAYAFLCIRCSARVLTLVTTVLTLLLGAVFASVAVWGSYSIIDVMVSDVQQNQFQFQQHYIILMLALSLLYAALMHPREMHKIVHGLAYLVIFPGMHLLLPIYSIANIVDQSWGTRDSQSAKIPKVPCIPSLRKFMKWRNKNKDQTASQTADNIDMQHMVTAMTQLMADGSAQEQAEHAFWANLTHTLLGNDVNVGLERAELASCLERLRDRSLLGLLSVNALWLAVLSCFYIGTDSRLARLNLYGIISGALYGFTLIIQVIGMTVSRVHFVLIKLARCLYGEEIPMWICYKRRTLQ